jgi:15-cis-phytoene desaturase
MQKKVVILGGGVAGMSAAHELIERGFAVSVYEFKSIPGGKARSIPVDNSGTQGRKDLPGEHGFRFFPGFYKHLPDTMKRIPYGGNANGVFDNLVPATRTGLLRKNIPMVEFLANFPKSLTDLRDMIKSLFDNHLNLTPEDMEWATEKLWQVMTSCDDRRLQDYQKIAWWDFIDAGSRSVAFQQFFTSITRFAVAAKAKEANTRTIGDVGGQLIFDLITPSIGNDRVLNGPTNDVWLYPWLAYLRQRGVDYHEAAEVKSIDCHDGKITGATIWEKGQTFQVTSDYYIAAFPVEVMASKLTPELLLADPTLENLIQLSEATDWMTGIQFFLKQDVPICHGHGVYMDSPWALTSVSQKQFWPDVDLSTYGDGTVQGIISVDISDWNAVGDYVKKPAMECSREEIRQEVWSQLKATINVEQELLTDDMLHSYFLDPDIHFDNPHHSINLEPLLVNRVGTWDLRPNAYTRIPNLFLASDYVRTHTDLATMEGANEAARRAVNGIIAASQTDVPLCEVWTMYDPALLAPWRRHDQRRFDKGLPWDGKFDIL